MSTQKSKYSYNVFIDLDRTLLSIDSGTALAKKAHREGLMSTRDLFYGLYLATLYRLEWRDTRKIINAMALWMKGISEDRFIEFSNRVVNGFLIPMIRPEMREAILAHKQQGGRIVMLSAALNYVCDPIGQEAGFDEVLCSHLIKENGHFTGKPHGSLCFGEEKLNRIQQYYLANPGNPENDYYFADSYSDVFVLRTVGHPVCVDPDRHLRRHAKKQGWSILD